jgi:hypothetical protein
MDTLKHPDFIDLLHNGKKKEETIHSQYFQGLSLSMGYGKHDPSQLCPEPLVRQNASTISSPFQGKIDFTHKSPTKLCFCTMQFP